LESDYSQDVSNEETNQISTRNEATYIGYTKDKNAISDIILLIRKGEDAEYAKQAKMLRR
jgi:hypothetical protein